MNKRALTFLSMITVFALFFLASCGSGPKKGTEGNKEEAVEEQTETASQEASEATEETAGVSDEFTAGKKIFEEKCVVCHQADATGMTGAFPPLANSDYLMADPKRGIHQVLNGSHEEMVVNGNTYNTAMTPQVNTKEDALAVVNYVLKYFNNSDKLLTMDDIADIKIEPRQE